MILSRDYQLTLLPDLGQSLFWPRLSMLRALASSVLSSFYILSGIILLIPFV
jgi:hypothetical protein